MTAAVWIVGGPSDDDRADLRYSLRSVAANAPFITETWVVGDVPRWFAGVRMQLEPQSEKFANQRQSITRLANYPGAPAKFVLMNDDMFVIEPTDGVVTSRYRNPLSTWAAVHRDAVDREGAHPNDCWQCCIIDTAEWTAAQTGTDPWLYECHTPLLFDTGRLRDALNAYPADRRFVVGELYPVAGCGGDGEHLGNAKVKKNDHSVLAAKLGNPMPYLSCGPDSWHGVVGDHIRAQFTKPCQWEASPC